MTGVPGSITEADVDEFLRGYTRVGQLVAQEDPQALADVLLNFIASVG